MSETVQLRDVRDRFARTASGASGGDDHVVIERGSAADFAALARFHYRSRHPGMVTARYRAVLDEPTVIGRYLSRRGERQTIGVLLRSLPRLCCTLRDHATHDRYRGMSWRFRGQMLSREFRTISRVVIDPRWRGAGLAVRMVKQALAEPDTIFTEALAAMGRVHPFFERAGMVRYERPPRAEHARLIDGLKHAGLSPTLLASTRLFNDRFAQLSQENRGWLEAELRHWHRSVFRTSREQLAQLTLDDLQRAARAHVFVHPIYYLAQHDAAPPQKSSHACT